MRLMLALGCALCAAQPPEPPAFKATTRLVEFTVVALDEKGRAVTDLKQDDIEILEKGKARPVAFFRFEGTREKIAPRPLPAGLFSNRPEYLRGPSRNVTALVLDSLNTQPEQMIWVRCQLVRYLKALTPESRVAVFHLGAELKVLHDFTDDYEELRARVEKQMVELPQQNLADLNSLMREAEQLRMMFGDDPVLSEMLAGQVELQAMHNAVVREARARQTLKALEALGAHLEGIRGRKNLVWIGGGISMLAINGRMGFGPHGGWKSIEKEMVATAQRLAQQGLTLYAVDARGLVGPGEAGASSPRAGRPRVDICEGQRMAAEMSADPMPAAHRLAEMTGGRVIRNTNDPNEGMKQAAEDMRGAYTVAFYAEGEPDGKWHGLKVRTKRAGVRLAHRQGFVAEDPAEQAAWGKAQWMAAASDPLGSTGISLDAVYREGEGGARKLMVHIEPSHLQYRRLEGRVVAAVEVLVAEKTATGVAALHLEAGRLGESSEAARYAREWKPAEGATSVRVVVRDSTTGRYGTLDVPLKKAGS